MHLRRAKNFLIPIIEKRLNALHSVDAEKDLDFLQYMIENAKNDERQSELLAHLELMVNVAGIHTSSMAITNAILDLCEHPEYITILREEIKHVLQDDGWQRNTESKLHKMDSFLKESQRFSPLALCEFMSKLIASVHFLTILVSFNRVALTSLTLSSGLEIPAGTHLAAASRNILFDPILTPNPDVFDGLRYYKMRENAAQIHSRRFQFSNLDATNLNFGAGREACPGRFLASMVLKLLLAKMLLKFDFQFRPGQSRPSSFVIDEVITPVPWTKILMRKRQEL